MQKFLEAAKEGKIAPQQDNSLIESNSQIPTSRSNKSNSFKTSHNPLRKSKSLENLDDPKETNKPFKSTVKFRTKKEQMLESARSNRSQLTTQRDNFNPGDPYDFQPMPYKLPDTDMNKKVKEMMWPYVKTPFMVNNFDHRFKAQEKILTEQTKMIKEQQKLIEDLKYEQSQVAFKEQIALLEEIKAKQLELEKMQKIQYKQEKKLLRKQAEIQRNTSKKETEENSNSKEMESSGSWTLEDEESKTTSRTQVNSNLNSSRTNLAENGANKKWDQFNKNMLERAKQREILKKEREEKRRKIEMEKLEQLKAQQEEKLKVEEEERKKKPRN